MKMEAILKRLGLERCVQTFTEQRITPYLVNKLSVYEMKCLGIVNRSDMMNLRTECLTFGNIKPQKQWKNSAGPPEFYIAKGTLENLLNTGFQIKEIAELLSVSESTVYRRMQSYGLSKVHFTCIDDDVLTNTVTDIIKEFPYCGESMLNEILRQKNIVVQRYRLRDILHEHDSAGVAARRRGRLHRRVYSVDGPNHIWHVDTNHKLIRWFFIIAGGVDGFSRLVTFLRCVNNNRADTLLEAFQSGVEIYGVPLRVRTDKGMENVKIADFMLERRGNGGILTGRSVHNQRIERLWRDVYSGVLQHYHSLFSFMEDEGVLDIMNPMHIYALHHVFKHKINEKLEIWRRAWGSHRLRTVHTSPLRLWTSGMLNNPVENTQPYETWETEEYEHDGETDTRPILESTGIEVGDRAKQMLEENIPENWSCSNFGINMYLQAVQILIENDS